MNKLIIISGPSCAGKTPLLRSLKILYPDITRQFLPVILYNSREPRPGEKEGITYYFRPEKCIRTLENDPGFLVLPVRCDLQALDLKKLIETLKRSNMIYEGNPFLGNSLIENKNIKKLSIFISPLSKHEITSINNSKGPQTLEKLLYKKMKDKLVKRALDQKRQLTDHALEYIDIRAKSAYAELKTAFLYDHVIPNHDGEDSDHWKDPKDPKGDAKKTLSALAAIITGEKQGLSEQWDEHLF